MSDTLTKEKEEEITALKKICLLTMQSGRDYNYRLFARSLDRLRELTNASEEYESFLRHLMTEGLC